MKRRRECDGPQPGDEVRDAEEEHLALAGAVVAREELEGAVLAAQQLGEEACG